MNVTLSLIFVNDNFCHRGINHAKSTQEPMCTPVGTVPADIINPETVLWGQSPQIPTEMSVEG